MKIIIEIPDEVYENGTFLNHFNVSSSELAETIYGGIPLPKGHGRLIDADELNVYGTKSIIAVLEAPTIIEADKGE